MAEQDNHRNAGSAGADRGAGSSDRSAGDEAIRQVKDALARIDLEGIGNSLSKSVTDVARQLGLVHGGQSPYIVRETGAERHAAVKVVQGAVALPVAGVFLLGAVIAGLAGSAVVAGITLVGAAVFGIGGYTRMARGRRDKRLDQVLRRMSEALGDDDQVSLNKLAQQVGVPAADLEPYVQEAINRGFIPEGRLTGSGPTKTLYLTQAAWEDDYRARMADRRASRPRRYEGADAGATGGAGAAGGAAGSGGAGAGAGSDAAAALADLPTDARELLEACVAFDSSIERARGRITDAQVGDTLDGIRDKVGRLAGYVYRHPQTAPQLRRLTTYYLPTTVKLARSYVELEGAGDGPQAASTRDELRQTFGMMDDALDKLLDDVWQYESMDVKSEAFVMKTYLKQDGLSPDE